MKVVVKNSFFGLLCLITSISAQANQQIASKTNAMIQQNIVAFMQKNHIPGAAVEIYINGVPHAYYYGYANVANKTEITPQTIFEVGSISKLFTSLLIAQQVNANHMKLDDSFTNYIPALADTNNNDLKNITLEELATHTSGLPFKAPPSVTTWPQLVTFCTNWKPTSTIGSQWTYSNMGVGLLGYSIEGQSHQTYDQLVRKNIAVPLEMTSLGVTVPKQLQHNYAKGYDINNQVVKPINMVLFPTAGAVKVSGQDMQKFLKAAIGLPGTPATIDSAMRLTQIPYVEVGAMKQGLAWEIREIDSQQMDSLLNPISVGSISATQLNQNQQKFDGNALIEKTGTTDGFRSYIAVIPDRHSGIVILTNRTSVDDQIVLTGRKILFNLCTQ